MSGHKVNGHGTNGLGETKLEVKGVYKYFTARPGRNDPQGVPKRIEVLRDISFSVPSGTVAVIVGPSGCGKTTLLRIIMGLIEPDAGEIRVKGRPTRGPDYDRGMVFQQGELLPWRSALGNVTFGLELKGVPRSEHEAIARRYLKLVGLEGFEHHYPHELSGGMQQRVGLARALAIDPEILLMDEPFGALDAQTRETMQEELLRIQQETGKTILFVTHDLDEAIYIADRVIVLGARPGRIVEEVPIPLPRPRPPMGVAKTEPAFLEAHKALYELLKGAASQRNGSYA